jgi:glycosyltransferase involved in cell wall biosynthesis
MNHPLEYDVIVVTRNRAEVLPLSIPLMLGQSRKPRRVIVVDSSDDGEATKRAVEKSMEGCDVAWEIHFGPRGITRQRNVGLKYASSPIVMFPDDDALWHPGVAESIMRVYERDEKGAIGGVCSAAVTDNPLEDVHAAAPYRMKAGDRLKEMLGYPRSALERVLVPDPFFLHGRSRWGVRSAPPWFKEENVVHVGYMLGYRMSFRADVIRQSGFDESLVGYGLFEDIEASFQVMKNHLVVSADNARVFHFRSPAERQNGIAFGYSSIMSRAYIIRKHAAANSAARRQLVPYSLYKIGLYLAAAHSKFGYERLVGAQKALHEMPRLMKSDHDALAQTYTGLLAGAA